MSIKIKNNAWGRLAAAITDTDTTISLVDVSNLPILGVDEYFYGTLFNTSNQLEIVKVTAIVGNDLTVERGAEGTTPRPYTQNDYFEQRVTAQTVYDLFLQNSQDAAAAQAAAEQAAADAQQVVDDFENDYGSLTAAITAAQGYASDASSSATDAQNAQTGAEQAETDAQAAQAAAEAAQAAAEAAAASVSGAGAVGNLILEPEGPPLVLNPTNDLDWISTIWQLMYLEDGGTFTSDPFGQSVVPYYLEPSDVGPREEGGKVSFLSRINMVGGGDHSYLKLSAKIDDAQSLVNDSNNVSISFWAKGSIAGDIGVAIKKYYGIREVNPTGAVIANIPAVPFLNPIQRPSICYGQIDSVPFAEYGIYFIDGENKILVGFQVNIDTTNSTKSWSYAANGTGPFRNINLGDYPVIDRFLWNQPPTTQYIAYADELGNLRCFEVDLGASPRFTQINQSQVIPGAGIPAIASSNGSQSQGEQGIFYYDAGNQELRFYEWVEGVAPAGNFILRGSIAIPGGGRGSVTRVGGGNLPVIGGNQYVAFIDSGNKELRLYRYAHTTDTWVSYGTPLSIPDIGIPSIASASTGLTTRIILTDTANGELRTYDYDDGLSAWSLLDTTWIKPGVGEVAITEYGSGALGGSFVGEPIILFADDLSKELRVYTKELNPTVLPSPWFNLNQQSRVEYAVQDTVSLTTDWQKFTVSGVYPFDIRLEYDHAIWENDHSLQPASFYMKNSHAALEVFINNGAGNSIVNGLGPVDYQGELYITNVQVNRGSVPTEYIHKDPRSLAVVEQLSQYLQTVDCNPNFLIYQAITTNTAQAFFEIPFKITHQVSPTILNATFGASGGRLLGNSNTPVGAQTGSISVNLLGGNRRIRFLFTQGAGANLTIGAYYTWNHTVSPIIDARFFSADTDN